jgi:UDP-glucose-4-epimerase GalE
MRTPDRETRVLVTGGAGYIGSHTCKALARAGFVPVTLDNLVYGHRWAVRWGPFVEGDLADQALLRRVITEHRIAAVIHFAAFAYVGESMTAPGKYFENNIANTLGLLETMRSLDVRTIVFSSTCATYGVPQHLPIDESHPQHPVNPYGESKLFVERALHWYGVAHGIRSAALRYFNAAGADPEAEVGEEHDPETHLIPLVIAAAMGQRPAVEIFGTDYATPDGTAVRDYIHVTDLAEAHVLALQKLLANGGDMRLNLGTGRGHSVHEVIEAVERQAGQPIPTRYGPRRPGDPPELVADPALARQVLDWRPRHSSLEDIVATAWAWHRKRRGDQAAESVSGGSGKLAAG